MFEFHGWIRISCRENDTEELALTQLRQDKLCNEIEGKIKQVEWCNGIFKIYRGINGEDHLSITGCANHHQQEVIDFLFWIADRKSDSYGLLHLIDHNKICANKSYGIRVWRLIKDEIIEFIDPVLSGEIDKICNLS